MYSPHFYSVQEFKLIDPKELQPLRDLIDGLFSKDKKRDDDAKNLDAE
jgi:hypothetical protein